MTSNEKHASSLSEQIHASICEVYGRSGALVSRWTIAVEAVHEDGTRATAYLTSPDMQLWEVIGMSESASEYARTQLQMGYIEGAYTGTDEEDDEEAGQ